MELNPNDGVRIREETEQAKNTIEYLNEDNKLAI